MKSLDAYPVLYMRKLRGPSSKRTAVGLTALCLSFLGMAGCGSVPPTRDLGESQGPASNTEKLTIYEQDIRTFNCDNVPYAVSPGGGVTFVFAMPDAPEQRLWANAPDEVPTCIATIPFRVPAGKKFEPLHVEVRGVAHKGHLQTYVYWLPGVVTTQPGSGYGRSDAYTFSENEPAPPNPDLELANYGFIPPLSRLDSPTCDGTTSHDVTLVVSLQRTVTNPHTHGAGTEQYSDAMLAVDSLDVGMGALESCSGQDPLPGRGEACGWFNYSQHDCKDRQTQVCVIAYEDQQIPNDPNQIPNNAQYGESGTCVDQSPTSPDRPSSLDVGNGEACAGPFKVRCQSGQEEQLVCMFKHAQAAQSNDHYTGLCAERKKLSEACNSKLYSVCDAYQCSKGADPCESGLQCTNGTCVAKKK